jgi:hypothetical protein
MKTKIKKKLPKWEEQARKHEIEHVKFQKQSMEMFFDKTLRTGYPSVTLHAIHFPVRNLAESIAFFERLDFSVRATETTDSFVSIYMQLSKNEILICLTQKLNDSPAEQNPWFELRPVSGLTFQGACQLLEIDGIEFINDEKVNGNYFEEPAILYDPDGTKWKVSEYPEYPGNDD